MRANADMAAAFSEVRSLAAGKQAGYFCRCLTLFSILVIFHLVMPTFGSENRVLVTCFCSQGSTVLVYPDKRIEVDYKAGTLLVNANTEKCCSYQIFGDTQQASGEVDIFRERCRIAGEVTAEPNSVDSHGSNEHLTLVFGSLLNRLKTVVSPSLERFGMLFVPHRERVTVLQNHPQQEKLRNLSLANEHVFQNDPLIRQIDPLGLLLISGGLVVERDFGGATIRYEYFFRKYKPVESDTIICRECSGPQG